MERMKNSVTRFFLLGGVLLTGILQATPTLSSIEPRFPRSTVLTGDDIEEAIVRGRASEVTPYLLNRVIGGGSIPRAAIYTPFVRVALAAMAGRLTFDGARILSEVAPQWIASPDVLVVFGSPCPGEQICEFGGEAVDPRGVSPTRIYIHPQDGSRSSPGPGNVATPIRVVPMSDLRWLGTIPVNEPVVAATFSPHEFRDGSAVVAEWGRRDGISFLAGGRIQQTELDIWR